MGIDTENYGRDWLVDQSTGVRAAFATRAALRSLPSIAESPGSTFRTMSLSVLRALVTAFASIQNPEEFTAEILDSYDAVFEAAKVASYSGGKAALSAAFALSCLTNIESSANAARSALRASIEANFGNRDQTVAAADRDIKWLEVRNTVHLFDQPLWPMGRVPEFLEAHYAALTDYWAESAETWGFWLRWYESMLAGRPLDWGLLSEVALIKPEVWEEGAEAVAKRIKEIEDEFYSLPDLDETQLASAVERIISQPVLFRDAAEASGLKIEATIAEYKADFANGLPEGFEAFEKLPPVYANIAQIIDQSTGADEIERLKAEIKHLHSVTNELKRDLRDAREQLRDKRLNAVEVAQMRTFGERLLTTLGCIGFIGTFGMSTAMFFGYGKEDLNYESLKEQIEGLSNEMAEIEPHPEVNEPEETLQGPKFVKPPSE